jgi:hypothetical protein
MTKGLKPMVKHSKSAVYAFTIRLLAFVRELAALNMNISDSMEN